MGKSLLLAGDLAARVSTGTAWPDGSTCDVGDVLIASGDDGPEDTLVPRLMDHGADLERVHFLECVQGNAIDDDTEDWGTWAEERSPARGGLLPALARALQERPEVSLVMVQTP